MGMQLQKMIENIYTIKETEWLIFKLVMNCNNRIINDCDDYDTKYMGKVVSETESLMHSICKVIQVNWIKYKITNEESETSAPK